MRALDAPYIQEPSQGWYLNWRINVVVQLFLLIVLNSSHSEAESCMVIIWAFAIGL